MQGSASITKRVLQASKPVPALWNAQRHSFFTPLATRKSTLPFPQPTRSVFPVRHNSSLTAPKTVPMEPTETAPRPTYHLVFTCKPCKHRSGHDITKQAYHHGSVLITCPSCKSRHIIADHLKIFMDEKSTLEDILRRKAADGDISKLLKKGKIATVPGQEIGAEHQDFEFWDESKTDHKPLV